MQVAVRALIAFVVTGVLVVAIMPMPGQVTSYSPTKILDTGYFSNPTLLAMALILLLQVVGLVVYYSRMRNRHHDRLRLAERELEQQAQVLKQTESRLVLANSEINDAQDHLVRTTTRIRLSVSRLLSSKCKPQDVSLLDISEVDKLQVIQDSLVEVFGVGSVIIDPYGERLTQHRNSTAVCALLRASPSGAKQCFWHQRNLGEKSFKHRQPVYKKCKACGLMCGGSPLIVEDRHIATWIIGQVKIDNDFSFDLSASSRKMGIVPNTLVEALELAPRMSISKFRSILELVWRFSEELSDLAFRNTQLISDVVRLKRLKPELQLAKKVLDQIEQGVLMLGPHGRVMAVSEPACVQLNKSCKELISLNQDEVQEVLDALQVQTKSEPTGNSHSEETSRLCVDKTNMLHKEHVMIDGQEYTYLILSPAAPDTPEVPVFKTEETID